MNAYVITGPESLIHAAFKETFEAIGKDALLPNTGHAPYNSLFFNCAGSYWLSVGYNNLDFKHHLTLPADWDKFMGILAELKKPKLPEYVKQKKGVGFEVGKVKAYDLIGEYPEIPVYTVLDPCGKQQQWPTFSCTPITEQEFIDGGLQELAEAGYVKGARYAYEGQDKGNMVVEVCYRKHAEYPRSYVVAKEIERVGFVFYLDSSGGLALPVGQCTLIPAMPTTSQGIPYKIGPNQIEQAFLGEGDSLTQLNIYTLKYLIRQGVTGLDTKAGRLTQADLELLTK
jgi:hypothetical protein